MKNVFYPQVLRQTKGRDMQLPVCRAAPGGGLGCCGPRSESLPQAAPESERSLPPAGRRVHRRAAPGDPEAKV